MPAPNACAQCLRPMPAPNAAYLDETVSEWKAPAVKGVEIVC